MRLLPQGLSQPSSWTDGGWFEKPGHPSIDGCWIHVPCDGQCLPEFFLVEEHQKIQGEPPVELSIGSGPDCHVRLYEKLFPRRLCRLMKRGRLWYIESLLPTYCISLQGVPLEVGRLTFVKDGDIIGLLPDAAYRIEINSESYAPDAKGDIYPNRYPARLPFRSSLLDAPEAPEELRRLAWQTDQMRRRSENDQVRVADWSNFSQYVKQHYLKHGIQCTSWKETGRGTPWDPKPPSYAPRPLPSWIASLLKDESPVVKGRPFPFASSVRASGVDLAEPQEATMPVLPQESAMGVYASEVVAEERVNPHLLMSIYEWLESIDDSLFMLQYYDQIISNFDSLKQIHDIYFHEGRLDSQFFAAAGIAKLGHKRIIEKWFREKC